jgi:hypothetical protein
MKFDECKVVQLIYTNILLRGAGTKESPYRKVEQWYDFEGNLVAEKDPYQSRPEKDK